MKIKILNKRKKALAINRGYNVKIFQAYKSKLQKKIYNQFKIKDL